MSGHAFVSYSRADEAYADRFVRALRDRGANVWIDREMPGGEAWIPELERRISTARLLIVIMTPDANASKWVQREINEAERQNKAILPLLLKGEPWFRLSDSQWVDVRGGVLPVGLLEAVVAACRTEDSEAPGTGAPAEARTLPPLSAQEVIKLIHGIDTPQSAADLVRERVTGSPYRRTVAPPQPLPEPIELPPLSSKNRKKKRN